MLFPISTATTLYTVYQFNITYALGANVLEVGSATGNCKVTTNNTSCTVTLPSITANPGFTSVGWSTTNGATTGTAVGESYTLSSNDGTIYANAVDITIPTGSVVVNSFNNGTLTATVSVHDDGSGDKGTYGWKSSTSSTCSSSTTEIGRAHV